MVKTNPSLAIDCAREYYSVALFYNETTLLKEGRDSRGAAAALLSMVDTLLNDSGCVLSQLDFIAVTHGPGSFTGLRIACAMVQGMAFIHNTPIVPLCTLQVMAQAYGDEYLSERVVTLLDAHREEIYWASYQRNEAGIMLPQTPPQLAKPHKIKLPEEETWKLIGDPCPLPKTLVLSGSGYYNASHLLPLGKAAFDRGEILSAKELAPLYLRDESAWKKN